MPFAAKSRIAETPTQGAVGHALAAPIFSKARRMHHDELKAPLIFPHQRNAFAQLSAIARAILYSDLSSVPVKARRSFFLLGPSGCGKTHLAGALAESLALPYLSISISEWILISSTRRSAASTWPTIFQFLLRAASEEGCVIFLDELDKFRPLDGYGNQGSGSGEYTTFLLTEVFSLLDLRIPHAMNDDDDDPVSEEAIFAATRVLRSKTLILGAGAFQGLWDAPRTQIGFGTSENARFQIPDLNKLASIIPRELINRFSSRLIFLPPLAEKDYHDMLGTILPRLPARWRSSYESLALLGIPAAAMQKQGPRFFEELMLEVVINERMEIPPPLVSKPQISLKTLPGPALE